MYADIVIDITHQELDRPFQYIIPQELEGKIKEGMWVNAPFGAGNSLKKGFVLKISSVPQVSPDRLKKIDSVVDGVVGADRLLVSLAVWMHKEYGGTLIQALKTVMPVKKRIRQAQKRFIIKTDNDSRFENYYSEAEKKHWAARLRLLEVLTQQKQISFESAKRQLNVSAEVIKKLESDGIVSISSNIEYRNTVHVTAAVHNNLELNEEQRRAADAIISSCKSEDTKPMLLYGITGSGKTEVYMEVMEAVLAQNRQVIVLIPEISLTYQVVMRFYARFGDAVSMINSKLSDGERFDQFERARKGEISIMIGPRSALFTPFENLGLIIMDEEQEGAYKSEVVPRYSARETAVQLARLAGAKLLLGSATPSIEAYSRALSGEYELFKLTKRAVCGSSLANVEVVDMRSELASGNRSVFSRALRERLEECLEKKQQAMLFINRRGFSRTVSCRSCGSPIECPHCSIALTEHLGKRLCCHYCGYTIPLPERCPSCGSPYLAGFGLGTERAQLMVKQQFPQARVLRMDLDTTSGKNSHEEILEAFAAHKADILVGTQMIVKGHDFPDVTLVGILAADMSLHSADFRSGERTFQLLTQAAGRAGRSKNHGNVVIQTYDPDNYCIQAAAKQSFEEFYLKESMFRKKLSYPPFGFMCEIMSSAITVQKAAFWLNRVQELINTHFCDSICMIGPSDAPIPKLKDMWRRHLFLRTGDHEVFCAALELVSRVSEESRKEKTIITITTL